MAKHTVVKYTARNLLHTALLMAAMVAILAALSYLFFGTRTVLWVLASTAPVLLFGRLVSPALPLRLYGARPVTRREAPKVYRRLAALAERAKIGHVPQLYYIGSPEPNAFTVGTRRQVAIAVTDGLLRQLDDRELTGVLAHEIAHVRDNDMRVITFAALIGRLTTILSGLGRLLLVLNLPMLLLGRPTMSWAGVLLLVAAPGLVGLLQLALSRTREFQADLSAARITGDPEGLASALVKMDTGQHRLLVHLLIPGRRPPDASLLRTHPRTAERVARLLSLRVQPDGKLSGLSRPESGLRPHTMPRPDTPHWRGLTAQV